MRGNFFNKNKAPLLSPLDLQTLKAIADHGDNKSAIRDVIHFTYFLEDAEARKFAQALLAQGFHDVELGQSGSAEDDIEFVVRAHHDGTLVESDIGERLSTIRKLAITHSGEYDGWEAAIVAK